MTAFIRNVEMPGTENTVSEIIVPPKAVAKVRPQLVTTGMSAFLMTCRKTTLNSPDPWHAQF